MNGMKNGVAQVLSVDCDVLQLRFEGDHGGSAALPPRVGLCVLEAGAGIAGR